MAVLFPEILAGFLERRSRRSRWAGRVSTLSLSPSSIETSWWPSQQVSQSLELATPHIFDRVYLGLS